MLECWDNVHTSFGKEKLNSSQFDTFPNLHPCWKLKGRKPQKRPPKIYFHTGVFIGTFLVVFRAISRSTDLLPGNFSFTRSFTRRSELAPLRPPPPIRFNWSRGFAYAVIWLDCWKSSTKLQPHTPDSHIL